MTAASVAVSDAWQERCLIGISKEGTAADVQFEGLTENVSIKPGSKDVGQTVLVNGGRVVTYSPEDMIEVTIKGFPYEVGTDTGVAAKGFFDMKNLGVVGSATQPLELVPTFDRKKHRIIVTWVESAAVTTPQGAVATGRALRFTGACLYCTNVEPDEFGADGPLSCTVTFKGAAFDKSASANYEWASTDGSVTLTAVPAYTTSVKF